MIDGSDGFTEFLRRQEDGAVIAEELIAEYDKVISAAKKLPEISEAIVQPEQRASLEQVLQNIKALRDRSLDEIPKAAGVELGFNELDGD